MGTIGYAFENPSPSTSAPIDPGGALVGLGLLLVALAVGGFALTHRYD